jgi:hypothetical protein
MLGPRVAAAAILMMIGATAQANDRAEFRCTAMGDGAYRVTIAPDTPDQAIAVYVIATDTGIARSGDIVLDGAVSGPGFLYRGEGIEFRGKGDVATLTDGNLEATCVIRDGGDAEPATEDAAGQIADVDAVALGGNVRTGPGTDEGKIGRLTRGTKITLLERMEPMLDGYPWFRVALPNGREGFVWGGIICAPQGGIAGVAEGCD